MNALLPLFHPNKTCGWTCASVKLQWGKWSLLLHRIRLKFNNIFSLIVLACTKHIKLVNWNSWAVECDFPMILNFFWSYHCGEIAYFPILPWRSSMKCKFEKILERIQIFSIIFSNIFLAIFVWIWKLKFPIQWYW